MGGSGVRMKELKTTPELNIKKFKGDAGQPCNSFLKPLENGPFPFAMIVEKGRSEIVARV